MLWNIVKSWHNEATLAKIRIIFGDYKRVLLEIIDKDKLPALFREDCTWPPHGCVVQIDPNED